MNDFGEAQRFARHTFELSMQSWGVPPEDAARLWKLAHDAGMSTAYERTLELQAAVERDFLFSGVDTEAGKPA